jgi:putative spermidine/putrescine transport system substrate-binding protein
MVYHIRSKYALSLPTVLLGAVLLASAFTPPVAHAEETIVFAGWGGSWQAAERKYYFDSFEKATGIKVIDVPGVSLSKIKAMVEGKNVEWDVVQAIGMWVPDRADAEDLWEPLDYSKIATDGVPKELLRKNGAPIASFAMILAYNTKAFPPGKQPKSWADFFDTKKYPGKRGFLNQPRYALDAALMAKGESKDKLYPLNVQGALDKWNPIKKDVLWWEQWPQAPTLLASGELAMTLSSQARIVTLKNSEKDAPVSFTWNQGIMTLDYLAVPKGSKHKEAAFKLISWMLDPQRQADYAKATTVGPSNSKALAKLDEKTKEQLPSYHYLKGELVRFDDAWWSKHLSELTERWNKWKLGQ